LDVDDGSVTMSPRRNDYDVVHAPRWWCKTRTRIVGGSGLQAVCSGICALVIVYDSDSHNRSTTCSILLSLQLLVCTYVFLTALTGLIDLSFSLKVVCNRGLFDFFDFFGWGSGHYLLPWMLLVRWELAAEAGFFFLFALVAIPFMIDPVSSSKLGRSSSELRRSPPPRWRWSWH